MGLWPASLWASGCSQQASGKRGLEASKRLGPGVVASMPAGSRGLVASKPLDPGFVASMPVGPEYSVVILFTILRSASKYRSREGLQPGYLQASCRQRLLDPASLRHASKACNRLALASLGAQGRVAESSMAPGVVASKPLGPGTVASELLGPGGCSQQASRRRGCS